MTTYYRQYIVVEPHEASPGVVMAHSAMDAAQKWGLMRELGGRWVAVQPLAGIGCARDALWERYSLVGPDCIPEIDGRGQL